MPEKEPKFVPDDELETAEILPVEPSAEEAETQPKSEGEKEAIIRKFFEQNRSGYEDKGPDMAKGGGASGMADETKENLLGE